MNNKWKTFAEWNSAGYLIRKGSKATNIDGKWLFGPHQVKEKTTRTIAKYSWDEATDENTCGGPMHGIYGNCD